MKSRSDLLNQAADLVNEVIEGLDVAEEGCTHCGLKRKRNLDEFRATQELFAVINKLEKWADHLKR